MTLRKEATTPVKSRYNEDQHLKGNIGLQGPRKVNVKKP